MSARMQVPLSQRRHTNIAVVRYSKNGVKLEIACYKNKVISYRSGVETRLDEVLQVERVFTNVSRGFFASEKEIASVFGKATTEEEALRYILDNGELQVAQQERTSEVDQMFKDVAVIISQKCVNSMTQRPFPSQVIEQALRSIGAAVKLDQAVKKQALSLIHRLIDSQVIPITRALMKLRCTTPDAPSRQRLSDWCAQNGGTALETAPGAPDPHALLFLLPPALFRALEQFVRGALPAGCAVHTVDSAVADFGGDVTDAAVIARANAHAAAPGPSGSPGTSRRTASEESAGGEGKGGRNKRKKKKEKEKDKEKGKGRDSAGRRGGGRHSDSEDEKGDENSSARDSSGSPDEGIGAQSELHSALSMLGLDKWADDDNKNSGILRKAGDTDGVNDNTAKGRRNKKKQQRRKDCQPQEQQQSQKTVRLNVEEDSDEEIQVNRKQRRQAAKAKEEEA